MNNQVHHSIADLARRLHDMPEASGHDDGPLRSVTAAAIANVPGARHAGVLLVDKKRNFETIAPTGPVMTEVDRTNSRPARVRACRRRGATRWC